MKSYYAHLFEVDKCSSCIGCLFGCPVVVLRMKYEEGVPRITFLTIPEYLDIASEAYRNGNRLFNFSYIQGIPSDRFHYAYGPEGEIDYDTAMNLIRFLDRFWVTSNWKYNAYMSEPTGVDEMLESAEHRFGHFIHQAMAKNYQCCSVDPELVFTLYNGFWDFLKLLTSPSGVTLFFPVQKLVGRKVKQILLRSSVFYLIYPYPFEPYEEMLIKAHNYSDMYGMGVLPNVGIKGMSKYVQRFNEDAKLYIEDEKCPGYVSATMEGNKAFGKDAHGHVICPVTNDKLMQGGAMGPGPQQGEDAAGV